MYTRGGHFGPAPERGRGGVYTERRLQPAPEGHREGFYTWGVTSDQHSIKTQQECTCGVSPQTLLPPPAVPQEAQQAPPSALRVRPGPLARGLRFPGTPLGLAPPPPSPHPPHGIMVSAVSPWHVDPFPAPGLGGERNYRSRPPLRHRACAAGVEVREAAALRALRRPRGGESGGGFRVGWGAAGGARYRTGGTGTGGV